MTSKWNDFLTKSPKKRMDNYIRWISITTLKWKSFYFSKDTIKWNGKSHTERWYFSPLKMDEGLVQKVCVRVCVYIYRFSSLITRKRQLNGKIGPQKGLKWQKTKQKKTEIDTWKAHKFLKWGSTAWNKLIFRGFLFDSMPFLRNPQ